MRLAATSRALGFFLLAGLAFRAAAQATDFAAMVERVEALRPYLDALEQRGRIDAPPVLPSRLAPDQARVAVFFAADGKLERMEVYNSSFDRATDARALEALRKAVDELPFPPKLLGAPFSVVVRVRYNEVPLAEFQRALLQRIHRIARYPTGSAERNEEGTVRLGLSFDAESKLAGIRVTGTSGHAELDTESIHFVTRALSVVPVPEALHGKPFEVEIPLIFGLKDPPAK
jgi:TonB family protein